uniref:Uncharacterized protein n=1 Tax=viral metagenome TaxID=1070528 RepID=A0A6C0LI40_9ZZZZ
MSAHNMIITKKGDRIPLLDLKPARLLDRTTVLYGKSNSGKSIFIKYIMKILKDFIPVAFVVSPTEPSNQAYSKFIDKSLIHFDLASAKGEEGFLEKLWAWSSMRSSIYHKVNKKDILMSLYSRIRTPEVDKMISKIEGKRSDSIKSASIAKCDEIEKNFDELIMKLVKKHIQKHKHILERNQSSLNEDELYSLAYLDLNPRVILIFDDAAAEIKSYFNKPIFRKIFYQSRHSFITSIFAVQDDSDLPPNLRKNVALSLFMTPVVAQSNFERVSNKYSKDLIKVANGLYSNIFVGYRKMAFIDNDPNKQYFYHITAEMVQPFKFGSHSLNNICVAVENNSESVDKTNPFYSNFRIKG